MWDHPESSRRTAGRGPRTKRQRRALREKLTMGRMDEARTNRLEQELEELRREPTLHTINWKA